MINDLAEKIWAAIQRPSPAVSKEEIAAILREGLDAPTADETYQDLLRRKRFTAEELAGIAAMDQCIVEEPGPDASAGHLDHAYIGSMITYNDVADHIARVPEEGWEFSVNLDAYIPKAHYEARKKRLELQRRADANASPDA